MNFDTSTRRESSDFEAPGVISNHTDKAEANNFEKFRQTEKY